MKKENVAYVCIAVGAVLVCVIIGVLCFNGNIKFNINKPGHEEATIIDEENRIGRTYKVEATEDIDRTIEISRSESAEFNVFLITESGDIDIDLFAERGGSVFRLSSYEDVENQKFQIEAGEGRYMLRIRAENFKGQFGISWTKADNSVEEEYTSGNGYAVIYNTKIFDIEKITDGEKFTLSKSEYNDDEAYLTISVIAKEKAEATQKSIFGNETRIGDCYIGTDLMQGKFIEKSDSNGNTEMIFCIPLEDGRLLVVKELYKSILEDYKELNKVLDKITIKK